MASGSITAWLSEGGKVEAVTDFLFLGCKITADGDCSHEIRRQLLLGRKVMTNLDSVLKSRDSAEKFPYRQAYGPQWPHTVVSQYSHIQKVCKEGRV